MANGQLVAFVGIPQASTVGADGSVTVTMDPTTHEFQIDLSLGLNQIIVLDSTTESSGVTIATILPPIKSTGTIMAGDKFYLYVDQDGTGDHPLPTFSTASGGFTSDAQVDDISGAPNATNFFKFVFRSGKWLLITFKSGVATS